MGDLMDKDPRKIEKRRSWTEISESASAGHEPLDEDYATELDLFERGEIDKPLWAKCLVHANGEAETAKWQYIKDRCKSVALRRKEQKESEIRASAEAQLLDNKRVEEGRRQAAIKKVEESPKHRRERERQAKLIARAIAQGRPDYYMKNPHMLQKDNTLRTTLLFIGALALIGWFLGA